MGTSDGVTSTKSNKAAPPQEHPSTPSYAEWAAAFQAYYGPGSTPPYPGYFPATVASGQQAHPYMWGGQPLIAPYGTPAPAPLYPYGGIYAHPALTTVVHPYGQYAIPSPCTDLSMSAATTGVEVKSPEAKYDKGIKRSKGSLGSLGMLTGTKSDGAEGSSVSANEHSLSAESGSEGSSEASEEHFTKKQSQTTLKTSFEKRCIDGEVHITSGEQCIANPVNGAGKPAAEPPMNLNISMDYWNASTPTTVKGKHTSTGLSSLVPVTASSQLLVPGQDEMGGEQWLQDEREVKRQRRKQSNRESARRSRLRKQAECEDLSTRVDRLTVENSALRTELDRLEQECKKLFSDNAALLQKLQICDDRNAEPCLGQDELGEKQCMQAKQNTLDQKRGNNGFTFKMINDARIAEHCESPAGVLPPRGQSDVTAAG